MSRRAKRPLNEDAIAEANAAVYNLTEPPGRKLDPNSEADEALRNKWMDAYVAAGGELEGDPPRPRPPEDPAVPCPLCGKALLIVKVIDEAGNPVIGAIVNVEGIGGNTTDVKGIADYGEVEPGSYTITAEKERVSSGPGDSAGFATDSVIVQPDETKLVILQLCQAEFHMHLDADRDGVVDDDRTGLDNWEWGKGKKGAIILCNNDDDDNGSVPKSDNEDNIVNTGNDVDELAPLVIRRVGSTVPPSWEAFLEVDARDKDKIRIFDSRSTGAGEIIGPNAGAKYKFPDLNFTEKEFGMEALQYASGGFDGEIILTFTIKMGGSKSYSELGKVRVAPWIMPNHLDSAEKVYVVDDGRYNRRFRNDLSNFVTVAGCSLQTHPSNDIWMQDCMEWGYSSLPNKGFRTVLRAPRGRPLISFPETLRKDDYGFQKVGTPSDITFNSSGNLECTPPVISKNGKKYPWGRIYFGPGMSGDEIDSDLKSFLRKQIVQEPIEIDTSWLLVGHVDEIISFVPSNSGGKGFKMLLASPRLAYTILRNNIGQSTATLLTNRQIDGVNVEVTINDFLNNGLTSLATKFTSSYLSGYNRSLQGKLDAIKVQMETELGLDASDTIEVPVIFADISQTQLADALTAGMVNMLVLNNHCIFPQPFGPEVAGIDLFQKDLEDKLRLEGLTPHPIDDWYEYHVNLGEVHCGTNTLRKPTIANWWEFEP